jgi:coenzyme F420-reducing hydrogenase beta subunit
MNKQLNRVFSSALKKEWTDELVEKYVGKFEQCYFTYATDATIREQAASGGTITALLAYMLTQKLIDGALVCRGYIEDGKLRSEYFIARSLDDLRTSQGSKYIANNFSSHALPQVRAFEGKLAVVGLPCDIGIMRSVWDKDPALQKKVVLMISLFCGHSTEPYLTDRIIARLNPQRKPLAEFRHRVGHWRGKTRLTFTDGTTLLRPFSVFSDYQNLYFFAMKKCDHCNNHTGYHADISAGDIWSMRMKDNPIKHGAMIVRNPASHQLLKGAIDAGWIHGTPEPIAEVCEGQARTMPFHHNLSARSKVGKLLGEKIKDPGEDPVRWNDWLAAFAILSLEKISRTGFGRWLIFFIPRPVWKLKLFFIKFLESF